MHSVEDYIMARYHMYWQVYFHPVSRSFESMLALMFARLKQLRDQHSPILEQIPIFNAFLEGRDVSVEDHFLMDEPPATTGLRCSGKARIRSPRIWHGGCWIAICSSRAKSISTISSKRCARG